MSEARGVAILTYSTQPRGGVVHAVALAEALHDLGHDVTLFALDDGRGFERAPRCSHRLVSVEGRPASVATMVRDHARAYVAALTAPGARRFAVYHAQDGISGNALATLAADGTIASFARTVHHLDAFEDPVLLALQDRAFLGATELFTVSELWADLLRARGRDATVVGNGVDVTRFTPVPESVRAALRAEFGPGPLFVTIGGVESRKNALGSLAAFALVRDVHPEARLVLAGGASVFDHGAYRQRFAIEAARLGVAEAVHVLGEGDAARIVDLLRAADVVVFPSLAEGFGLIALEALACGSPVVLSAIEPFVTYVPRALATFVDPAAPPSIADGMLRALAPEARRIARSEGPAFAARFPWRLVAERHLAPYARLRARTAREAAACPR